ncbi:MAG TPA: membrane protein insertion efficiency factor YidD [Candidatus Cloacimonas sp.]|nr:membrane protein insertion efficiency factor YidD [Candidatus Cloacimonas sp.]MDD2251181.1 membrane protein insertion efficiency factor YidD [Candidatus Cloacimonadota bacterium]MCK9158777.1 membrane protein insertion efficiency factor YidD [Candidatus Cloacimonas sp.]MCK9165534.1 membrane protein insertion efficiency factor YidD [Candidatus Cloacimonas sp.]MDD3734767.1 membrane protein insertion efficiency factor YidD [Candidatus Cloacimonadota bacterium]
MAGIIARAIKSNNSDKYKSGLLRQILRLPNLLFLFLIRFYQLAFSPFLPPSCRFEPSCSVYGYQAFKKYNFFKAFYLTSMRILKCNPFHKGGYDPLP